MSIAYNTQSSAVSWHDLADPRVTLLVVVGIPSLIRVTCAGMFGSLMQEASLQSQRTPPVSHLVGEPRSRSSSR